MVPVGIRFLAESQGDNLFSVRWGAAMEIVAGPFGVGGFFAMVEAADGL